jgi:hypothetical protein
LPANENGLSEVRVGVKEIGLYRLDDGDHTAVAAVGPLNPLEFSDVRTTERYLAPVAEATGGSVNWLKSRAVPDIRRIRPGQNSSGPGWIGLLRNDSYLVTGVAQFSLMPPWIALILIVGLISWSWWREAR